MKYFKIYSVVLILIASTESFAEDLKTTITAEIEKVNTLRESLVQSVPEKVTPETFKAVCAPVGQQLKAFGEKHDLKVKQASHKFRNPAHKPNAIEGSVIQQMQKDKDLVNLWKTADGGEYYFRRITVQNACLKCHGAKAERPDFIKAKYPNDKAFGFKEGDLRGIYSVFVKGSQ